MPRRPSGLSAMTSAERQARYRSRNQLFGQGREVRVGTMVLTRHDTARVDARPRGANAEAIAASAAEEMVAFKKRALRAARPFEEARERLYVKARNLIADALQADGLDLPRRRAEYLIHQAIKDATEYDDDLTATMVWGKSALSAHRGRLG